MKAGATAFTRIPRLANSSAAVLVKPSTACLLAGLVALLSEMVGLVVKVPCPVSAGCDKGRYHRQYGVGKGIFHACHFANYLA
jgi:hypothetical protein